MWSQQVMFHTFRMTIRKLCIITERWYIGSNLSISFIYHNIYENNKNNYFTTKRTSVQCGSNDSISVQNTYRVWVKEILSEDSNKNVFNQKKISLFYISILNLWTRKSFHWKNYMASPGLIHCSQGGPAVVCQCVEPNWVNFRIATAKHKTCYRFR